MSRIAATLLLFFAAAAVAQSPARVQSLEWMSGSWVNDSPQGRVLETWLGPANGMIVAANLTSYRSGRGTFEFLRIAETADGLTFYASPGGNPPVPFRTKEIARERVVFENTAHDFPQRVLYWRDGADLMARIEGVIDGKERSQEWRFKKMGSDPIS